MFLDSNIDKNFQLSQKKCSYIIIHGLASHFKSILTDVINRSSHFTVLFDESLNVKLQRGQMDILIRYWNVDRMLAETRYLKSQFLDGASAWENLENNLEIAG